MTGNLTKKEGGGEKRETRVLGHLQKGGEVINATGGREGKKDHLIFCHVQEWGVLTVLSFEGGEKKKMGET